MSRFYGSLCTYLFIELFSKSTETTYVKINSPRSTAVSGMGGKCASSCCHRTQFNCSWNYAKRAGV